ncbi:ABC transporter permease [Fictibacillus barbaricus]|uniref:ABC transporter permease n=1 Tax=Fictibacillus barbaricus TaxID=182136 RepID=A0ABS2ZBE6_9BACL|nr:ABC transporter permease [Fictibacillus barbaricus]MBN3545235.1 ABC transporter permease [Fictibacillus barbaricus]GGB60595.1 transport permease protein [Fictibacillus barbaricus]
MRIKALVKRIIRQFIRDKRTLAMMFIAPLLILTLVNLVFSGNDYEPKIAVVSDQATLSEKLEETDEAFTSYKSSTKAFNDLETKKLDAIIEIDPPSIKITLEGSNPTANKAVMMTVEQALKSMNPQESQQKEVEPEVNYLHGSTDMETFDYIGPFLIGFFIFFFVFLIAGVSFLRERTTGTLERLLATPLRRWEMVAGYVLGFGIFTVIQSAIIVMFAIFILDIMMAGSIWYVILITLMLAFTALSLGTLLSAFAKNELQMIQFIPLVVVPQVFFSGLFNIETMAEWLQPLSYIMPLTYGGEAMRDVMIRGGGWPQIYDEVLVLAGFSLLFMTLNVLALKKHRKL